MKCLCENARTFIKKLELFSFFDIMLTNNVIMED